MFAWLVIGILLVFSLVMIGSNFLPSRDTRTLAEKEAPPCRPVEAKEGKDEEEREGRCEGGGSR